MIHGFLRDNNLQLIRGHTTNFLFRCGRAERMDGMKMKMTHDWIICYTILHTLDPWRADSGPMGS